MPTWLAVADTQTPDIYVLLPSQFHPGRVLFLDQQLLLCTWSSSWKMTAVEQLLPHLQQHQRHQLGGFSLLHWCGDRETGQPDELQRLDLRAHSPETCWRQWHSLSDYSHIEYCFTVSQLQACLKLVLWAPSTGYGEWLSGTPGGTPFSFVVYKVMQTTIPEETHEMNTLLLSQVSQWFYYHALSPVSHSIYCIPIGSFPILQIATYFSFYHLSLRTGNTRMPENSKTYPNLWFGGPFSSNLSICSQNLAVH